MVTEDRERALRVARLLVEKAREDEAVAILAAWACNGPNDKPGQDLLAEALRISPGSQLAKMAFQRMEGVPGDHGRLDEAMLEFDAAALAALEKQLRPPVFRKAQLGFNNNVQYQGAKFHVQTEDSGLDRPHVITHLFADGGRIVQSYKRDYSNELGRADVAGYVRSLMKAQHLEMCVALREGQFDEVIAGRAPGQMVVFDKPPRVKIQKGAGRAVTEAQQRLANQASDRPAPRVRLLTVRCLWGGEASYEPLGDEVVLGSQGTVALSGERFAAPREAVLRYADQKLRLIDLAGGNGVFVRIRHPVELVMGDEFLVGDQLLQVRPNPTPDDGPGPGPTYFYASPRWRSSFRVVQLWEGGMDGAACLAQGAVVQIGRIGGDMAFAHDPLLSDLHCVLEETAGAIILTDLESKTGTFVRVTGEREIQNGDELAIGRTRMRVELV